MASASGAVRKRMSAGERRDQILDAARAVFVAQGLGGSRIRDIAATAKVNEALLYRHFSSKEELFEAAVVEPLEEAVAHLVRDAGLPPVDAETSREEMVERTRLFVLDLIGTMRELAPLLGVMIFGGESSAADHYKASVEPVLRQVADVVRTNLGWWEHREFDPDQIVRTLFGAVWFETVSARVEGRTVDADSLARDLADMVILGLAVRD